MEIGSHTLPSFLIFNPLVLLALYLQNKTVKNIPEIYGISVSQAIHFAEWLKPSMDRLCCVCL